MCQEAPSALPSSGESCEYKEMQVVAQKILKAECGDVGGAATEKFAAC